MTKINVQGIDISIAKNQGEDYICITDMAKSKNDEGRAADVIKNWIRTRTTIEFLGTWESLYNPNFKVVEFDHFRKEAGLPTFTLSVASWAESTNAIGIYSKLGKYGGTYAHKDIAFEFGSAISSVFKLYLIKEFQRLKEKEEALKNEEWDYRRFLSKVNYRLHTDAIKESIIPKHPHLTKEQESYIYANEAELLNMAVFGITSKQWRQENAELVLKGYNIRDLANIHQLTVVSNAESYNSILISKGMEPKERYEELKKMAIAQLKSLVAIQYYYPIDSPIKLLHEQDESFDG